MLEFRVESSDKYHVYKINFEGEGENLSARCSCPAYRQKRLFCKHIAALLNGDESVIIEPSDKIEELKKISINSPLLEKAGTYIPYHKRNLDKKIPSLNEDIKNLVDVGNYIDKLLEGRDYKKEYESYESGLEILTIDIRTN